jgi:hypothetical protein
MAPVIKTCEKQGTLHASLNGIRYVTEEESKVAKRQHERLFISAYRQRARFLCKCGSTLMAKATERHPALETLLPLQLWLNSANRLSHNIRTFGIYLQAQAASTGTTFV